MLFSDLKKAKKLRDQVTGLDLGDQQLKSVPTIIKKFPALTSLDISNNPIEEIPSWLPFLSNLTTLNISNIPIKSLPKTIVNCQALTTIKSKGLSTKIKNEIKASLKMIEDANHFELEDKARLAWWSLYFDKEISKKPDELLLTATNSSIEIIQNKALQTISFQFGITSKKQRVNQKSHLTFSGILKNRIQLQERLTRQEISFSNLLKQETTHLVIGPHTTITDYDLQRIGGCLLLTEKDLQKELDQLEQPYLMTEDLEEGINNLRHMLQSTDDQLELAIEIMSGGGVPKSLETEVFVVWKLHFNSYFQAKARRLLERFAQSDLANFMKNDHASMTGMTENQLEVYLKRCQKKGGLDANQIAEVLYSKHRKGIRFIMNQPPASLQKSIIAQRCKGETLNLSRMGISKLPLSAKEFYSTIKHLDLSHNPIKEIAQDLKKILHLETLNLTGTNIKELPNWFSEIDSLRKIILDSTKMKDLEIENGSFLGIELVCQVSEK